MTSISLDTAAIVTDKSKSTWHRRIADGLARRVEAEGKRTLLALEDVAPLIVAAMAPEDIRTLVDADRGNAEAQDEMGQFFLAAGKAGIGAYWLTIAAGQNHPNAMQTLGHCYAVGRGVPRDENLALMWIANAAAHGHAIALQQVRGLRSAALR